MNQLTPFEFFLFRAIVWFFGLMILIVLGLGLGAVIKYGFIAGVGSIALWFQERTRNRIRRHYGEDA